jgi:hypothetical protein
MQPRGINLTIISSIGIFLGAIIQANIFGELTVIMAGMNKNLKEFDL